MFKAYFDNGQLKVEGIYNSGKKQVGNSDNNV